MTGVLGVALVIIAIIVVCGVVAMAFVAGGHALERHIDRAKRAPRKPVRTMQPCCPPGLGCNDPDESSRACLRREARRMGTAEEIHAIDAAWVKFNSTRGAERQKAHVEYHQARDGIIRRAIDAAAARVGASRPLELPAHLTGPEVVDATVEPMTGNGSRKPAPLKPSAHRVSEY